MKGCGECHAPPGGPCANKMGYCFGRGADRVGDACDVRCPHRVYDHDVEGTSPYHCRHPELVEVRLASAARPKPTWCPMREGGALTTLSLCVSCGSRFDPAEDGKGADVCRLCAHLIDARQHETAFVFERNGRRFLYTIGREPTERELLTGSGGMLGFGGRKFVLRFLSDGRRVISHNCWMAGEIPRALFDAFPTTVEIEESR